jgi:outer membrane protein OmpA-like peptidoglycan-associated protein
MTPLTPRHPRARAAGVALLLAVAAGAVAVPAHAGTTGGASTADPTAQPAGSAPAHIDPDNPRLKLPDGATLAAPRVLDIVSVTDSSAKHATDGDEREETSNSQVTYALQAEVLFKKDSYKLNPGASARIRAIATDIAEKNVTSPIRVFGFTDNLGTHAHGVWLSKKRAQAVYQVLSQALETQGGGAYSFQVRGYAEDYPIADNSTEAGRRQNRRVEITFTPPTAADSGSGSGTGSGTGSATDSDSDTDSTL